MKNDIVNGYVYIKKVCRKLYKDKLEGRLRNYNFGLEVVHMSFCRNCV